MAIVFATYASAQDNRVLVAAQGTKRIRVVMVVVTTRAAAQVTLLANPGPDPSPLTPALHVQPGTPLTLCLGRRYALAGGSGQALGLSTAYFTTAADLSVLVWYEVVP